MPLTVIRASAGSGKTYQLAVSFIRILLEGELKSEPRNPAAILATTFTRTAAGEILDRVLRLLAEAVLSEERRKYLAGQLGLALSPEHCERLLASLARTVDRLAISTMDAFFAQIAKAFAGQLGLAPDWQMAVDEAETDLLRNTIHAILEKVDLDSVMDALWTYRKGFVSSVQEELADIAGTLNRIEAAHGKVGSFKRAPVRRWTNGEIAAALRVLGKNEEWIPRTKAGAPSKNWFKPLDALGESLATGNDVTTLLDIPFAAKLHADGDYYNQPIPAVLRNAMKPLLAIACDELRARHRARAAALKWLARHYQEWRQRASFSAGGYTFDDIATMVTRTTLQSDELYFRLGARFEHVLFDEFQDTSRLQFKFFRPMIEEIGATGGEVLVVGDEKQAIYGWRGGDRELMHGPLDELGGQIGAKPGKQLIQSFRSSPAVLDAVNCVFEKLRGEWMDPDHAQRLVLEEAGVEWSSGFVKHEPAPKVANLRGAVRVLTAAEPADEDRGGPLVSRALELVGEHLTQDPNRKIGVLLRKRNLMPRIIAEIRSAHPDVDVSGEGGNPLTDSRAVELILGLLTCLDHPGHTAARYLVLKNPAAAAFGFPANVRPEKSPRPSERRVFRTMRRSLMDRGFAAVLREWIRHPAFASRCSAHDLLRCEQLIGVAREFDVKDAPRPDEFVAHVRTRRIERPGGSGVRVMTIHAAKGLEFEAVILLELDARQGGSGEPEISETDGALAIIPPNKDALYLGMTELIEAGARRDFMEELSVLYVGMTRACSFLDIVLREHNTAALAQLLRRALPHDPNGVATQAGGLSMRECNEAGDRPAPPAPDPGIAISVAQSTAAANCAPHARIVHATPSARSAGGTVNVQGILAPANRTAMHRGELIHAMLARISWLDDGLPEPDALAREACETVRDLDPGQAVELAANLIAETKSPATELHRTLTQIPLRSGETAELWRERRFAVIGGPAQNAELLTGSFDRVVLWRDAEGRAARAKIADFKTDHFSSAAERAEIEARYAPQLEAYRKALCLLCSELDSRDVQASLTFVRAGIGACSEAAV